MLFGSRVSTSIPTCDQSQSQLRHKVDTQSRYNCISLSFTIVSINIQQQSSWLLQQPLCLRHTAQHAAVVQDITYSTTIGYDRSGQRKPLCFGATFRPLRKSAASPGHTGCLSPCTCGASAVICAANHCYTVVHALPQTNTAHTIQPVHSIAAVRAGMSQTNWCQTMFLTQDKQAQSVYCLC